MPSGDTLRTLFRGHAEGDDSAFVEAAYAIVREERAKNHRLLADDLEAILRRRKRSSGTNSAVTLSRELPRDKETGLPLVSRSEADYSWDRLVVPNSTLVPLMRIANEYQHTDLLVANGVRPKSKVLFYGKPGCGKTIAAKVLASQLGRPLITVRFDAVVSSLLGSTASNLRRVFEYASLESVVLFFDEFDAIGKSRDSEFEHGELKRVVNTLLLFMDDFSGDSLMIAASNHELLLDLAIWRRFDGVIRFPVPEAQDRLLLLRNFLRGYSLPSLPLTYVANELVGATGADIEMAAVEAVRTALLDGRRVLTLNDFEDPIRSFNERRHLLSHMVPGSTDSL